MNLRRDSFIAAVAAIALMVDSCAAFCCPCNKMDGLGLMPGFYGALPAAPLPPPPAPAMPCVMPLPALPPALPPMYFAPPPPPPPPPPPMTYLPMAVPPPAPQACPCGCCDKNCGCLSYLKPCLTAKILNMKKKLLEKKLTHLLSCCAQYNSNLYPQPCAPAC